MAQEPGSREAWQERPAGAVSDTRGLWRKTGKQ